MSGVCSEGLSTTALPATSGATQSAKLLSSGKFQGPITPTTPRGWWTTRARLFAKTKRVAEVVGERPPPDPPGVEAGQLEGVEELDELGLVAGLTALGDQGVEQARVVAQRAPEPPQPPGALAKGRAPQPGCASRARAHGLGDRVGAGGRELLDELAGRGVDDAQRGQGVGGAGGPETPVTA